MSENTDDTTADEDVPKTVDVLRPVFESLSETNSRAAEILMEMATDGRVESHQTHGTLRAIADELLATTESKEEE